MQHKVLAYITRYRGGHQELLVFAHRDHPEAGLQVPAGTVDPGEPIEAALWREVREESGLGGLRLAGKVAEQAFPELGLTRHAFHVIAPPETPDRWAHTVHGRGEDAGLVFEFFWIDTGAGDRLAGGQGRWLDRLADPRP